MGPETTRGLKCVDFVRVWEPPVFGLVVASAGWRLFCLVYPMLNTKSGHVQFGQVQFGVRIEARAVGRAPAWVGWEMQRKDCGTIVAMLMLSETIIKR